MKEEDPLAEKMEALVSDKWKLLLKLSQRATKTEVKKLIDEGVIKSFLRLHKYSKTVEQKLNDLAPGKYSLIEITSKMILEKWLNEKGLPSRKGKSLKEYFGHLWSTMIQLSNEFETQIIIEKDENGTFSFFPTLGSYPTSKLFYVKGEKFKEVFVDPDMSWNDRKRFTSDELKRFKLDELEVRREELRGLRLDDLKGHSFGDVVAFIRGRQHHFLERILKLESYFHEIEIVDLSGDDEKDRVNYFFQEIASTSSMIPTFIKPQ